MKKFISLLFLIVILYACEEPKKEDNSPKIHKVKVLSTIAMIDDLVSEIGKDYVENTTLIKGEIDPHTYELVKGDDEKFASADLIFYNGLGLEHGYSLRHNLESHPNAISLGDVLLEKVSDKILKVENQYDPHVWMDISLWINIVDPIVEALVKKDALHAEIYVNNGLLLKEKMKKADEETYNALQNISSEKRYLVTSHNAFHYFVRRYLADAKELDKNLWKCRLNAPEGLAPEAELSSLDIQRVLDYVVQHNIEVVFPESNVNKESLKKIVNVGKKKGLSLRMSEKDLYADAMGQESSYLEMIAHNTNILLNEFERQ